MTKTGGKHVHCTGTIAGMPLMIWHAFRHGLARAADVNRYHYPGQTTAAGSGGRALSASCTAGAFGFASENLGASLKSENLCPTSQNIRLEIRVTNTRLQLRAGMTASRLNHRGHVIPALTDHLEDKGGVIGLGIVRLKAKDRQSSHNPNFHIGDNRCSDATEFPQKDYFVLLFVREIATMPPRACPRRTRAAGSGGRASANCGKQTPRQVTPTDRSPRRG
jgi:hypothetical protein